MSAWSPGGGEPAGRPWRRFAGIQPKLQPRGWKRRAGPTAELPESLPATQLLQGAVRCGRKDPFSRSRSRRSSRLLRARNFATRWRLPLEEGSQALGDRQTHSGAAFVSILRVAGIASLILAGSGTSGGRERRLGAKKVGFGAAHRAAFRTKILFASYVRSYMLVFLDP